MMALYDSAIAILSVRVPELKYLTRGREHSPSTTASIKPVASSFIVWRSTDFPVAIKNAKYINPEV